MSSTICVILDLDDTLICSSWIACNIELRALAPEKQCLLAAQEESAISLVRSIRDIGGTPTVISNANRGWIRYTMTLFPRLSSFFQRNDISIFSARDHFEQRTPHSWEWKMRAFMDVIRREKNVIKVVSIGDGLDERKATLNIERMLHIPVSSIKFVSQPSLEAIISQQRACVNFLPRTITSKRATCDYGAFRSSCSASGSDYNFTSLSEAHEQHEDIIEALSDVCEGLSTLYQLEHLVNIEKPLSVMHTTTVNVQHVGNSDIAVEE